MNIMSFGMPSFTCTVGSVYIIDDFTWDAGHAQRIHQTKINNLLTNHFVIYRRRNFELCFKSIIMINISDQSLTSSESHCSGISS